MDFIAVEALIANLHPRAERSRGGKVLDRKTNSLGRGSESTTAKRLASTTFGFWHEQLGRRAVIEYHCFDP